MRAIEIDAAGLAELLSRGSARNGGVSHVGQVARLREFAERLKEPCTFKEGDLITPTEAGILQGHGEPHLVIQVVFKPFDRQGDIGGPHFARPNTIIYARITEDREISYYGWHGDFELYKGDGADA